MSIGRVTLGVVGLTVVAILVFLSIGRRDLGGISMSVGLMLAILVPTLGAAVRKRLGVVGLVSAMIGLTFSFGLFLPAAYGKRTPTGELGFGLVIGSVVMALIGVFVMLPFWIQLRNNRELRRARAATASLGWVWLWRISGPSGLIDGVRVTLAEKAVTAELPVPVTFGPGLRAVDVVSIACLGPRWRAAVEGLERHHGVTSVSAERGVLAAALSPEVDGEQMAVVARLVADAVRVIQSEVGPEVVVDDKLVWFRRAAVRVRGEDDPGWRLVGLEALAGFVESMSFGNEWQRLEARQVVDTLISEILEDDPHPRVALFAAEKRGDLGAVGRIRARLGMAGGGLALANDAAQGELALSERQNP
ncbi:MAG TPA: hypothetical protein PK095_04220 [Myxococcota bacterium]|nr:hypothetical protein [Myxococcota bacterium]